ncbi:thiol-disulfide oxidoreductase DCC family protein [Aliamphritea ceti]|uniref:thiol-disulfide oxidoreductase DCC family protein n=1 Tax=Aliamphritea ceti TaxID=1524258 RepID=UPI0021C3BF0D|nr:DUF393 domain-containing protein [Aliamphritea ceti]
MANITVFYDGSCPRCVKDRERYENLDPAYEGVEWFDITGQDDYLKSLGIDPYRALTELHVLNENGQVLQELDAYILLLGRIPRYRWIGWLLGLPVLKQFLSALYRWSVKRRLRRAGRL